MNTLQEKRTTETLSLLTAVRDTCQNVRLRGLWPRRNSKKRSVGTRVAAHRNRPGTPRPAPGPGTDKEAPREGPQRQAKDKARTSAASQSKEETKHKEPRPRRQTPGSTTGRFTFSLLVLGSAPPLRPVLGSAPWQRWSKTAVIGSQLEAQA